MRPVIIRKIDINQARQRLGERAKQMKDKDIQEILNSLYFLCESTVQGLELGWGKGSNAN